MPNFLPQSLVAASTTASGTAYTLTNAFAAVDFGTTDPSITIPSTGTYILICPLQASCVGATFAAAEEVRAIFRRTNNTPADIGTERNQPIPVMTTLSVGGPSITLIFNGYSATAGDIITINSRLSATPSAGSVTISNAQIFAIRTS